MYLFLAFYTVVQKGIAVRGMLAPYLSLIQYRTFSLAFLNVIKRLLDEMLPPLTDCDVEW